MHVLADFPWDNSRAWIDQLRLQAPAHQIHVWPDLPDPGLVEAAIVWRPKPDFFRGLDALRAVIVPGAGVDQLFSNPSGLPDVPVIRLADPVMADRMAEYVLAMVLDHHRQFGSYRDQQASGTWRRHAHKDAGDIRIGILGLGVMGAAAAHHLQAIGYAVTGWTRSPKVIPGIRTVAGKEALAPLIAASDVLVCLLPLTDNTRGILNAQSLAQLPEGALLINAARGAHLVVPDLLNGLERGRPAAAVLDVFEDEPLSKDSPLWRHGAITITPHIASLSHPVTGVAQIVRALDRIEAGEPPDHVVNPTAGY